MIDPTAIVVQPRTMKFGYTNWQSRHSNKTVEMKQIWYGTLEKFYPGSPPQWYWTGIDLEKNEERSYQLSRMESPSVVN